jgi:hypothetical protein
VNPFPNGITNPPSNTLGLLTNVGNGISFNNPNSRTPRTYQYSFAIQRELPWHTVMEVAYAGNREIFVPVSYNMANYPQNQAMDNLAVADPTFLSHTVPNPFYGVLPINSTLGASPNIAYGNLIKDWPLFTGLTQNRIQVGEYRSDQLQLRVEKRVIGSEKTGVFTYVLSYTFGKQMQKDHRNDNWNLSEPLEWEIDDGTKIHELAFSGVYDLPIGRGKAFLNTDHPVFSRIASNWRFDYILTYSSGFPVAWPALLNYCGVWSVADQNENHWFNNNKSCYSTLPPYVLNPNLNRFSTIFNPAVPQLNIALEKTIPITERYRFVLRGESFNVTNTPLRPGPDTTFTDAQFGMLPKRQQNFPRVLQIAGKFYF